MEGYDEVEDHPLAAPDDALSKKLQAAKALYQRGIYVDDVT